MKENIRLRFQKYSRREFWPGFLFNIPVYLYFCYLAIRAKHIGFFSNINPCMTLSGFAGYGKQEDLDKFDSNLLPKTLFIQKGTDQETIEKQMKQQGIIYPCIAKPTLGRTGRDVKKLHNSKQMKIYLKRVDEDLLIQEFIDYPLEFGIFYYRMPDEKEGHITGIVEKKFMFLRGDGKQSFEKLVINHPRARYYYHQLKKEYPNKWKSIISNGEIFQLNYLGNHCRGSVFYDASELITPELEKTIDNITKNMPEFYYGRYDIKVKNTKELYTGNIKIIELNGMGSLPTHIYDPKHTVRHAYKTLFQHRKIAFSISKQNKARGYNYMSFKEIKKTIKQYGI